MKKLFVYCLVFITLCNTGWTNDNSDDLTDNQIKKMNADISDLRSRRNNIQDHITSYAEQNNLDNAIIEISDGNLRFNNYKQSSPLTFKYIQKCLFNPLFFGVTL